MQIAKILDWPGDHAALAMAALMHDVEELATGDIPSPFKRAMFNNAKEHDPAESITLEYVRDRFDTYSTTSWQRSRADNELHAIIKVADMLDWIMYLLVEASLGNLSVGQSITENGSLLKRAHDLLLSSLTQVEHTVSSTSHTALRGYIDRALISSAPRGRSRYFEGKS